MSNNQQQNSGGAPQGNKGGGNAVQKSVQAAQKARKMAQNVKKVAHAIKNIASSGPLMYVLFWVFVVIVAIIIITGLIMFIITMPGMIMEKLKAIFKELGNALAAFFGADTTQQIDEERIYETMDYIEDMGWDLKSEGFLTSYYEDGDDAAIKEKIGDDKSYTIDENQGVVRDDNGNIILAESDFIFTYIMSDNYVYTLKNKNIATQNDGGGSWWDTFCDAVATAYYKVANFVYGPVLDALEITEGMTDAWGKGLIMIYYDKGLGIKGDPQNTNLWNWDTVEIDTESKKLSIRRKSIFNNNNAIEFSLDGWTGRYGMPLEFLLSVHKATMMPDLAFDMATSFNTNVNVYLHDISGEATAAYKTPDGQYITYETVNKAKTGVAGRNFFSAILAWFDNWVEGDDETIALSKLGVDLCNNKDGCTCKIETSYCYYKATGDDAGDYVMEKDGDDYYFQEKVEEDGKKSVKQGTKLAEDQEQYVEKVVSPTDVCDQCHDRSKQITKVLGKDNDYNFKAYMPYIANVSDHWYRDVFFVLNKDTKEGYDSVDDIKFVDYDYDYESVMKERWTLYETYPDDASDPIYGTTTDAEFDEAKVGEFIIYLIDDEGEYKKNGSKYMTYAGSFEEARGDVLYIKNDKGEYTMYTGVIEEDNANTPTLYRKVGKDKYEEYDPDKVIAVAKKAITIDASDTDALKDVGWKKTGSIWTAYEQEDGYIATGWQRLYEDEELTEIKDAYEKNIKQNAYINMNTKNNIVQVGEGQRTETNAKIKKMFLTNKYFRYDGSEKTAEIITALREKNDIKYGALDEDELKKEVTIDGETYKASDYAGTVVLNQDSLNAFSMLENTHTLDSDYIYRDFKELVVELGYFEKEELTDETPKLLQFPVPEIGSSGYPDRTIDKRENEIGTMVHSTHDIVANKKYTLKELVKQMGEEITEEGDPNTQGVNGVSGTNLNSNISAIETQNSVEGLKPDLSSRINNDRLNLSANNIKIDEVGAISAKKSPSQVSVDQFLKSTREMCEFINKVGYDYCVYDLVDNCSTCKGNNCVHEKRCLKYRSACSCGTNHCKHNIHENSCVLPTTFEESKVIGKNNLCCATLVAWALQNVGVMPDEDHMDGAESLAAYCLNNLKGKKIEKTEELEPGDILCYEGHIDICGEKVGGNFIKYNGGHQVQVGASQGGQDSCIEIMSGWPSNALYAVRLDWGKHEDAPYEGFLGNEAVVSPVSGILLEYGEYNMVEDLNVKEPEEGEPADPAAQVTPEEPEEEKVGRINVDLKYGPSLNLGNTENTEASEGENPEGGEPAEPAEPADPANPEEEEEVVAETRELYEKVGYAKILVLNKEIFEMLDSTVNHRWRNDNDSQGLLSKNGQFYEMVTTEEELEELTDDQTGDFLSETVYGYKEFTETYERYGIAGYYLYIDGFKCELPDPDFIDSDEDGELSDEAGNPDGEDLTYDSFKIKTTQIENENKLIESLYEAPVAFKVASQKATEKLNTEEAIKADTYGAMVIDNPKSYEPLKDKEELIFIKEGTVLGRTYTDKELVEERLANGDNPKYNFEYYAPEEKAVTNEDGEEEENLDKLIGNYVRVRMMDPATPIENVENYMKLDEVVESEPNDWELFFWLPFESGGTDEDGCGPESQGSCSSGETAVGIIQWTVLTSKNMNNISSQFIEGCLSENYTLCAPLNAYRNWSAQDFWNDWNGGTKAFQKTLSEICDTDRDTFLSVQMQVAKKQYLEPLLETYPWLEQRPSCVQGAVMHLRVWGASTDWLTGYADSSDEEIVLKVRNTIANTSSTAGEATGDESSGRAYNEPQIALEILSGAATTEDVEKWVRTRDTSVFDFKFK